MTANNTEIDVYLKNPNRVTIKTLEFINIIKSKIKPDLHGELLDIGCGNGIFIRKISEDIKKFNFTGFDFQKDLIKIANDLNKNEKINFFEADINSINFDKKFDIICASGVLSIFQEFEDPLKKWLSWLKKDGLLFVCGRFNSRDVDTKILFKNNSKEDPKWEGGFTSYSVNTISNFIEKLGFKCTFKKFTLPIEIKEDIKNPIRTFTKEFKNGEKIIMNGANIVSEYFFLTIGRDLDN